MTQLTIFDHDYRTRPIHSGTVWCLSPCMSHYLISGHDRCPNLVDEEGTPVNYGVRKYFCGASDGGCYLERLAEWERENKKHEAYRERRRAGVGNA